MRTTRAFEWIMSWWKSSQRQVRPKFFFFCVFENFILKLFLKHVMKYFSVLILHWESTKLSATLVDHSMSKKFQKGSRTFFILFSDDDFSEVFFWNYWNISLGLEKNFILCLWWLSWWFNGFCFVWKLKWMFPKKQKFVAKDIYKRDHICCKDFF